MKQNVGDSLLGIRALTRLFLLGLPASLGVSGFFGRWLKFRIFVAAVAHKAGGPGCVGPGEDLTVEMADHFNHVTGRSLCSVSFA